MASSALVHVFTPSRETQDDGLAPTEPPITRMFASFDGQWLAAVNCFGDVYVFNLEILRLITLSSKFILPFELLKFDQQVCSCSHTL